MKGLLAATIGDGVAEQHGWHIMETGRSYESSKT